MHESLAMAVHVVCGFLTSKRVPRPSRPRFSQSFRRTLPVPADQSGTGLDLRETAATAVHLPAIADRPETGHALETQSAAVGLKVTTDS